MAKPSEIVPASVLHEDTAAVLKRLQDTQEPLLVTHEGRASAIMLSIEAYERVEREREILRLLVRGEQEIAAGVGHDLDEVLADVDALLVTDPR